jgi:leucyl aminopeptidase
MELKFQRGTYASVKADAIAVFVHQDKTKFKKELLALQKTFGASVKPLSTAREFSGKLEEIVLIYSADIKNPSRLIVVGLGERSKLTLESYRRAAATAAKKASSIKASSVAIHFPTLKGNTREAFLAFAEGAALALYKFDKYIEKKKDETTLETVIFASNESRIISASKTALAEAAVLTEAVYFARDLENAPPSEIYPESLARLAEQSAERAGFSIKIMEEEEIKQLKMGGIIGVGQGSAKPPRLLILEYGKEYVKVPVVLVGKGVTFDSGGISLKPGSGMAEMKMDMSGAAAVLATFEAVARLKLRVHIVGLIPAVENLPSGTSYKPGDILRHYNGKTSEIDNTDAEGRLILADALAYADTFKPSAVIDLATLTGAVVVALGNYATGMMGNDQSLMNKLKAAGEKTYERLWQLPMYEEYESLIKSDVADVKNVGKRGAGTITAAMFLKKFIGKYKWAHLDIAGTAIMDEATAYTPKGGSGVGVRLLVEFLKKSSRN